jgi:hypothetical protein
MNDRRENDPHRIIAFLRLLFRPGDVFEVRALDAERPGYRRPHVESGYFDFEHIDAVPAALAEITAARGIYVTLNPVNPALLARAANRIRPAGQEPTTSDADVLVRRWLPVDCDPVRPAGISATDAEHELAVAKANEVRDGMATLGWSDPVVIDSGNGGQLLYPIDLPAEDGGLVQRCLQALASAGDDRVEIDQAVHNPARIWRLPGTWNCKGDSIPDRPHRLAKVLSAPDAPVAVPGALLGGLAQPSAPVAQTAPNAPSAPVSGNCKGILTSSTRPGDDFNQRGEIAPVLEAHGWQRIGESGDNQLWRRPGKTTGNHSATFDGRTFYVFSSAATPFEANAGYSPFAVYAMLEHVGDYAAASASLAENGYGAECPTDDVDISGIMAMCGAHPADDADNPEISATMRTCGDSRSDNADNSEISADDADNADISATMQTCGDSRLDSADSPDISADDAHISDRPADPGPLPEDLLHVPGFIAEVMDYTMAHAPTRNPAMAFAGAVALMSLLGARKVSDPAGNRTNLYILALALSGSGKDFPRKVNSRILRRVGLGRCVVQRFGSAESIEDKLCAVPAVLCQTDEFDGVLLMAKHSRDPRYDAILDKFKELYTSSDDTFTTRELVSRESREIHQPSLTVLGTAVPVHYYNALSEKMLTDGFFSRTIAIEAAANVTDQEPTLAPIPEHIIEVAEWWARFNPGGGNLQDVTPVPAVVPMTDEATELVAAVRALARERQNEANARNDAVTATVWSRVRQMTRKLALIHAISVNHEQPCIDRAAVEWARDFVVHHARRMLFMAGLHVSENPFHAQCLKVVKLLHEEPECTATRSRVLKYLKCTARELNEIADTLEQQGQIVRTEIKSSTKRALAYRLAR